jgi:PhzF family phenazine biosynthesis protein
MQLKIYQVDAFADKVFGGNPAAICPLEKWLPDDVMQKIAMENNLAETAFYIPEGHGFHIRWFTPKAEVNLCGHATLATAFVLFELLNYQGNAVSFQSRSGELKVTKNKNMLTLNFPTDKIQKEEINESMLKCFDKKPVEVYSGRDDFMFIYNSQYEIENIKPDFNSIAAFKKRGIIITAKGNDCDFVSRYFAPAFGINEDPVTGSAHTTLTPYWTKKLGKTDLTAVQLSERKGHLKCKFLDDRVEISGEAKLYMTGEIFV